MADEGEGQQIREAIKEVKDEVKKENFWVRYFIMILVTSAALAAYTMAENNQTAHISVIPCSMYLTFSNRTDISNSEFRNITIQARDSLLNTSFNGIEGVNANLSAYSIDNAPHCFMIEKKKDLANYMLQYVSVFLVIFTWYDVVFLKNFSKVMGIK